MISDNIERKFIESTAVSDWEIETDSGWQDITVSNKTVPYLVYELTLKNGMTLRCADTHIVFRSDYSEVYVCDLVVNDEILTECGPVKVATINKTDLIENMYDLSVDSDDHRYYTNGILSHNTTTAAGYLLWYAMFIPDSTILVAAHKFAGAQEIMQRVRYAYEMCPNHIRAGVVSYNKGSIEFDNGSRIVSQTTTETTGRGMSISLLYSDEFSFVRPSIAREFWSSISPTLSTGGKAILTSTPNSDEDQFADIWHGANKCVDEFGMPTELGINGFKAFKAVWDAHPERDEVWAIAEKAKLGVEKFNREHLCLFISADETLINATTLSELTSSDPVTVQGQIRWYRKPNKDYVYMVALDPSLGTGGDFAAIQVFESPSMKQVAEWQHNRTPVQQQVRIMRDILNTLLETVPSENLYYSVENNTLGEAALVSISELGEENIPGLFICETGKLSSARRWRKGFTTTSKSKLAACAKLKNLLETHKLTVYSRNLISELKTFIASGVSFAAKIGETDDLVMSLILIVRMAQEIKNYHPDLDQQFTDRQTELIMPMPFIATF